MAALQEGYTIPGDVEVTSRLLAKYPDGTMIKEAEFTVPINGDLALDVAVRLEGQQGDAWEILRWQTVYTGECEIDESMDIWDGT